MHYTPTGGADPVVKKLGNGFELLWTNPSPSSAFAAQTVALDLSKYKYVAIESSYSITFSSLGHFLSNNIIPVPTQSGGSGYNSFISSTAGLVDINSRNVTTVSSGITFGNGENNNGTTGSSLCIPLKIYGIADIT